MTARLGSREKIAQSRFARLDVRGEGRVWTETVYVIVAGLVLIARPKIARVTVPVMAHVRYCPVLALFAVSLVLRILG